MKTKYLIYSLTIFLLGSLMAYSNPTSSKVENVKETLNKIDSEVKSSSWDDMDKEIDEDLKAAATELKASADDLEKALIEKNKALETLKKVKEKGKKLDNEIKALEDEIAKIKDQLK